MINKRRNFEGSVLGMDMADVEEKLPESLRQLLAPHTDANEFLTALVMSIVITGGIMPEIWTNYLRRKVYSMLMLFVVCPPAGGKA